MAFLRIANTGRVVATRVERTTNFIDRAIGLLARPRVRPDEGLWIDSCNAIHTLGMRATIDVIFVDRVGRVLQMHRGVPPFRFGPVCLRAASVVELGAGALDDLDLLAGDRLELIDPTLAG